jgi:cysteine-rich repeat protein
MIVVLLVALIITLSAPAAAQTPPATPFATIPGGPIGVACIGDGPGGITDRLVVTSYCTGNIHTVSETGSVTTHFPTGFPKNWCGIESYLALSTGLGGWPVGDIYASFGPTVYKINSTLTTATPFVTIAGKPGTHTGVTFDRTGVWNFDMIVTFIDGTVYRVTPSGTVTFVATTSTHQESPRVIPNDATKWGAFAGCISTASENTHKVFAICNPGSPTVSTLATGILNAESSDIRPSAGETTFGPTPYIYFASRHTSGKIWGYPASSFPSGSAGDMFVSQEFGGGITRIPGSPGTASTFEAAFSQHYEGSNFCFIPQAIDTSEKCSDGIDNDGDGLIDNADPDCHVCGDGNIDPGEQCDDGNIVSGDGCSSTCKLENKPPIAQCQNVTVNTDPSVCSAASASVNNGSSDPDGDTITLSQTPSGPYGLGQTQVTLTVTDTKGASDSCQATVTVNDVTPPAISCPAPQVVECTGNGSANATVGSPTVTDNCSVASTSCTLGSGSYPLGTTNGTCSANDGSGNSSSCNVSVTVVDTTAPTVSCVESYNPSTKNVPKASNTNQDGFYKVGASDICSTPVIKIGSFTLANGETIKITQTPGKSGVTYVNTMGPAAIKHFQVGPGDAVITATDGAGNSSSVTCLVPPPPK